MLLGELWTLKPLIVLTLFHASQPKGRLMDRLGMCVDALRVLARSSDPDRAVLVEGHIDAYLTTETGSVWQALERLCKGIRDEQAEGREGEDWSVAKRYIRSALQGLA
jgi:hypothetical protein